MGLDCTYEGWKQALRAHVRKGNTRLDCTYEGWKPLVVASLVWRYDRSLDCTYEGWKHVAWDDFEGVLSLGLDCTYEGWKPPHPASVQVWPEPVWIAPMRDGNAGIPRCWDSIC